MFCVTNFAPLLVFRWFNQPVAHLPPRMATPGAAAASCGQEALICLVRLGLFEYVRPHRRNLASRVGCWKVSRALRLADGVGADSFSVAEAAEGVRGGLTGAGAECLTAGAECLTGAGAGAECLPTTPKARPKVLAAVGPFVTGGDRNPW